MSAPHVIVVGAGMAGLAAAVDLDQRNADVAQDMFRLASLAQCVDRRVRDDPQLVALAVDRR